MDLFHVHASCQAEDRISIFPFSAVFLRAVMRCLVKLRVTHHSRTQEQIRGLSLRGVDRFQFSLKMIQQHSERPGRAPPCLNSLPKVAPSCLNSLPKVAPSCLNSLPKVAPSCLNSLPKVAPSCLNSLPKVAPSCLNSLPKVAPPYVSTVYPRLLRPMSQQSIQGCSALCLNSLSKVAPPYVSPRLPSSENVGLAGNRSFPT